jgi:hypothetical protein
MLFVRFYNTFFVGAQVIIGAEAHGPRDVTSVPYFSTESLADPTTLLGPDLSTYRG